MTLMLALAAQATAAAPAAAPSLASRIKYLISHSPVAASAYWGIEIADAITGVRVYKSNAENFFVPASNTKLFSTAMTLSVLGSHFQIPTTVNASQPADPDGVLSSDLILKGGGDPSLITADIESLADQIFARGIRRIGGSVVGDDTTFVWEPYNPGWSIDDAVEGYGAPIGALTLNDNSIILHMNASGLSFEPPVPLLIVENQIQPDIGLPDRIHYERLPGSNMLRLWGTMRDLTKDPKIALGVDDPARYAALVMLDALQRRGIQVTGKAEVRHRLPGVKFETEPALLVLATHESAPLLDDLRVTEKTSQNLHAETYLRLVASQQSGQGSRAAGIAELHAFLDKAGIDQKEYSLQDGSGLSRLNVVTPHAVVELLIYMAKSSNSEDWTSMLSISGVDGTLERRMKTKQMQGKVQGKTGSLSHVTALSGYAQRTGGKRYAFSILVNNYNGPASDIRSVIDKICALLVN